MYQVCFVILHYLSFDATCACIDSICDTIPQTGHLPYHVVVVDNASPNDSFALLGGRYRTRPEITLLQAPANLGFAKGNNLGYRYALEHLHADFIITANNDTEFRQRDFLELMAQTYENTSCALIGPDILHTEGYHQNPYRPHPISKKELSRWIRNRRLWLLFLSMDRYLRLSDHFPCFEAFYRRRAAKGRPDESWDKAQTNVVLHGACILFTPLFTASFQEYAFYPDTFLYCEEDILALLSSRKGLQTCYEPRLQILHKESVSTNASHASCREKDLFFTRNILRSLAILKKLY